MLPFLCIILGFMILVYFAISPFFAIYPKNNGVFFSISIFYTTKLLFMIQNWMHRSASYLRPKTQHKHTTSHFSFQPPTQLSGCISSQSTTFRQCFLPSLFFIYHSTTLLWSLFCSCSHISREIPVVFSPEISTVPL